VTEFAGKDLSYILEKQKRLKLEEIRNYFKQIVSALLYLNDNRIVHRDLKPQNILIRDGVVKLCDFGFARKMSAATICLHSLKGTPLYIAPEIISEKPYNHKIDIWSLGIIIYELHTGVPPFHADTYYKLLPKILHDKVKYPKDMDVELRELIEGMLQKAPSSRYDW
jgi:fused-like protein